MVHILLQSVGMMLLALVISCSNPFSVESTPTNAETPAVVTEPYAGQIESAPLLIDNGDHFLLGGDIILNKADPEHQSLIASLSRSEPVTLGKSAAMQYVCVPTWPKGVVTYSLTGFTAAEKTVIQNAMKAISTAGNVTYTLTTATKPYIYKISKIASTTIGGESTIGYTSTPYCRLVTITQQTCIHEFMHGIGFGHEHQRYDRDKYIKINMANILTGYASQFQLVPKDMAYRITSIIKGKAVTSTTMIPYSKLISGYDYASIMHYPKNAFAKAQNTVTIVTTNTIGTTTMLSSNDKSAIVAVYGAKAK